MNYQMVALTKTDGIGGEPPDQLSWCLYSRNVFTRESDLKGCFSWGKGLDQESHYTTFLVKRGRPALETIFMLLIVLIIIIIILQCLAC